MGILMTNTKPRTWRRTLATLTVGFLAGGVAIAATYPAEADAAAADQVTALTAKLDAARTDLADVKADLSSAKARTKQVKTARDQARTERDNARSQVDTLTATLDGQYDVNADYAAKIQQLKARKPETVTKEVPVITPPTFYEDGSWAVGDESGCAPTALCDDEYQDALIADVPSHLATWSGFRVGEVILCPKGWDVSIDDAEDGQQWAACM